METHGSRVKKYGIYIDQMVEKIKVIQNDFTELFETISFQTSTLIKIQNDPNVLLNANGNDSKEQEIENKDGVK